MRMNVMYVLVFMSHVLIYLFGVDKRSAFGSKLDIWGSKLLNDSVDSVAILGRDLSNFDLLFLFLADLSQIFCIRTKNQNLSTPNTKITLRL